MQTTNLKQQQLTFDKGITNVPSDAICSDNALEESLGLVYENGEHRVIQRPRLIMITNLSGKKKLLYVHNYNNVKRYIFAYTYEDDTHNEKTVYSYGIQEDTTFHELGVLGRDESTDPATDTFFYEEGSRITSIGKTLIITDSDGIHYFLWKEGTYKKLENIPALDVNFWLEIGEEDEPQSSFYVLNYSPNITYCLERNNYVWSITEGKQEDYNTLIVGLYSKNKKAIDQKKGFCEPFFARAALELYDGTYTFISQPVLLFPSVTTNLEALVRANAERIELTTYYAKLHCAQTEVDYTEYSDIIKDVVIFVSRGIPIWDTTYYEQPMSMVPMEGGTSLDQIGRFSPSQASLFRTKQLPHQYDNQHNYNVLEPRDPKAIIEDFKSTSVFYKLCSIGLHPTNDVDIATKIDTHKLENLTTQDQLKEDDYYSRTSLVPEFIYAYNSRLNIANVSRSFFEGYDNFLPYDNNELRDSHYEPVKNNYWFYVTIRTDSGNKTIRHTALTAQKQGIYFFYPDPRASHVLITKAHPNYPNVESRAQVILDADLTEHPGLNGAYYLRDTLPTADEPETPLSTLPSIPSEDTLNNNDRELLPNYIIQSEVNNPFVFKAEGYHKVSTGKILAMSSTTMALSQDQFGKTDLLVFSDAGLWGLQVDRTGTYDSIHPITRDVLTHANTVTQTDGAVFFATKKGLMVVSENGVACVSEQLNTMPKFLDSDRVRIAYDYRDSLLWLFKPDVPGRAFVYGMKSRTFASFDTTNMPIEGVVGDYPDNLLQDRSGTIYSLIQRDDIHDDDGDYSATLITRPMKLENAFALKRLIQVLHVRQFDEDEAKLTLRIFASNNLRPEPSTWVELHSLRGTPWKYYRFRYDFTSLKATDRFAGTVLVTREERTDKLR